MPAELEKTGSGAKVRGACRYIRELAHQLGPAAKLPTTVKLRESLGVSITTLDVALRELEKHNIICRKHGSGLYVSPHLQRGIALLCDPDFFRQSNRSQFWDLLTQEARTRALAKNEVFGFHFSTPSSQGSAPLQPGLVHEITAGQVQGVLCVGLANEVAGQLAAQGVPYVVFAGHGPWKVTLDFCALVRMGVDELAGQGCKRLGLWLPAPESDDSSDPQRTVQVSPQVEAFRRALEAHGLDLEQNLVLSERTRLNGTGIGRLTPQEQGYLMASQVFAQPRDVWPDGVIVGNDLLTQGALTALQKMGLRPGEDVKIASHANRGSSALSGYEDSLALLEFYTSELVESMFGMLETLMDGQTPTESAVLISPHLRQSEPA